MTVSSSHRAGSLDDPRARVEERDDPELRVGGPSGDQCSRVHQVPCSFSSRFAYDVLR
jgi:hypothetical protein